MRRLIALLFTSLLAVPLAAHGNLKFVNGLWLDGDRFVPKTMYSVDNILRDAYDGPLRATIDLGGRYVVPPFADAHNHVLADGMNADAQIRQYLRAGIFYVQNPNNLAGLTAPIRAKVNRPESVDVRYANGGITASGGHPIQIYDAIAQRAFGLTAAEMRDQAYFVADTAADLDRIWPLIVAGHPDVIKTYLDHSEEFAKRRDDPAYYGKKGLDPAMLKAIVARAHAAKLRVVTHVVTAADVHNALVAGVDELAHLPLEPLSESDAQLGAKRGVVFVTTLLSHRPHDGVADLSALYKSNLELLKRAGAIIAIGVDNGDKTAVNEVESIHALGVFKPLELLKIWWEATPHAIFPERKIGRLRDGYEASFLALDGNPLEDFGAIRRIAIRVKQGHEIEIAPDKPGVADVLKPIAIERGAAAAIEELARLEREKPAAYDYGEAQLNQVGYALLTAGKSKDAIAVFTLNAERHPQSANVWDSLGEAYMTAGDQAAAIAHYRKSLQLNPHNENAAAILKKLGAGLEH
jgi:tetratricopeptide (TPR) repeat protein